MVVKRESGAGRIPDKELRMGPWRPMAVSEPPMDRLTIRSICLAQEAVSELGAADLGFG